MGEGGILKYNYINILEKVDLLVIQLYSKRNRIREGQHKFFLR